MSRFVQSLKRLYRAEKITKTRIDALVDNSEITQEEYEYIISNE